MRFAWEQVPPLPLPAIVTERDVKAFKRAFDKAQAASEKLAQRRADLPPGSSRASVTTLNARWSSAAEERDRLRVRYETAIAKIGIAA